MTISRLSEKTKLAVALALALGSTAGCTGGGNDTGGGGNNQNGNEFVDGGSSAGSIDLAATSTEVSVADSTGFRVSARDQNGGAVELMRISCDTEEGLTIIEPSTGSEFTDSHGDISGVLGCDRPGSFQFVCRGPIGSNRRDTTTIKCTGDIPAGFGGFSGAGGGLGGGSGGVGGNDDGNSGSNDLSSSVLVSAIDIFDVGTDPSLVVDVTADSDCDNDSATVDPEPFVFNRYDVTIRNNSNRSVFIQGVSIFVPNATGAASGGLSLPRQNVQLEVPANGGEAVASGLLTDAGKVFAGTSTAVTALGSRNLTFTVTGESEDGESFEITGGQAVSFTNVNNCTN